MKYVDFGKVRCLLHKSIIVEKINLNRFQDISYTIMVNQLVTWLFFLDWDLSVN